MSKDFKKMVKRNVKPPENFKSQCKIASFFERPIPFFYSFFWQIQKVSISLDKQSFWSQPYRNQCLEFILVTPNFEKEKKNSCQALVFWFLITIHMETAILNVFFIFVYDMHGNCSLEITSWMRYCNWLLSSYSYHSAVFKVHINPQWIFFDFSTNFCPWLFA